MANLAFALKEEITRLVRRELKSETAGLKKASSRYRSEIAALKRQVADLERQVSQLEKRFSKQTPPVPSPTVTGSRVRFSTTGLKKLRARLEMSAPVLASILQVSAQTIYKWEAGTSRPSKEQIGRIVILRKMGKREVQERLAQMRAGE